MSLLTSRLHFGYMVFYYAFTFAPLIILVIFSFNDSARVGLPFKAFTLKWYAEVLSDPTILSAIANSLLVGAVVTLLSTPGGTAAAFVLVRHQSFVGRKAFNTLVLIPMVIPPVIVGISLLTFFHAIGLELSLVTVILAHTLIALPFSLLVMVARLIGFDRSLEEAAMDLGADELTTFLKVTLPLIFPGLLAAAILAFTISFGEVAVAFFTIGYQPTLPVYIFGQVRLPTRLPVLTAVSALALSFSALLVVASEITRRIREKK